ncbi:hypothetical protein [Actinocorallia sp. A-T 12471]|uniref:hypothetical protein n=1 Tax=Actinocorallia sp. A-T 12471 TaxID=3089813 RepID=UPI0029CE73F2|nr:hypothetical protein [Actinocorallia sp. A-T 12471]MDX6744579.1 hypothetical protein [Actinocorallia sp. A-T 12471]
MRSDRAELLGGEIPLRPLSAAEMLDAALALLRRSPRAVLGPALVVVGAVQVAVTLAGYFLVGGDATGEVTPNILLRSFGSQAVLFVAGWLVGSVAVLVLAGAFGPAIARGYFGLPITFGIVWRDVRPSVVRLVVLACVVTAGSLAAGGVLLVPFVLVAVSDGSPALGILAGVFGFPAAAAVAVLLYVLGCLAAPALVLERRGVGDALSRSVKLVRGQWWKTFFVLLLTAVLVFLMGIALRLPFIFGDLLFFGSEPQGWRVIGSLALDTAGRICSAAITTPFNAGVLSLLYLDRRNRREGLDLEIQQRGEVRDEDPLAPWAVRA